MVFFAFACGFSPRPLFRKLIPLIMRRQGPADGRQLSLEELAVGGVADVGRDVCVATFD